MEFSKGQPKSKLQKLKGAVRGTGTSISFSPDPTIFPRTGFNADTIKPRLEIASFLHRGVKVIFIDDVNKTKETYFHENGIKVRYLHSDIDTLERIGHGDACQR